MDKDSVTAAAKAIAQSTRDEDDFAAAMAAISVLKIVGAFEDSIIEKLRGEVRRKYDVSSSPATEVKVWRGTPPGECDLCHDAITTAFIDGKTVMGPWANMCRECFVEHGVGIGQGQGQRYDLRRGQWVKTGG